MEFRAFQLVSKAIDWRERRVWNRSAKRLSGVSRTEEQAEMLKARPQAEAR
jgi:hypothetical protein